MEIGRSLGSVATGRTATSAKPFFSRTRRDATLAASGPASSPAPGHVQRTAAGPGRDSTGDQLNVAPNMPGS